MLLPDNVLIMSLWFMFCCEDVKPCMLVPSFDPNGLQVQGLFVLLVFFLRVLKLSTKQRGIHRK